MKVKKNVAVYPGTFDPITAGHADIIQKVLQLFKAVIVVVAKNPHKATLFTVEERMYFIRDIYKNNPRVKVLSYEGLMVDLMEKLGSCVMIRGLRAVSDFEYELQMALTNRSLNPKVETVFLTPDVSHIYLNSGVAKEIAQFNGDLSRFVTPMVAKALKKKFGVT